MSASFCYRIVQPQKDRHFSHGTSHDAVVLRDIFGKTVSDKDIPTLRAMHRATGRTGVASLWSEIADTLERIKGDDYESDVHLEIWVQF